MIWGKHSFRSAPPTRNAKITEKRKIKGRTHLMSRNPYQTRYSPLRSQDTPLHLREPKLGPFLRNDKIAIDHHLQAASKGAAIDRGNEGFV
jgi:hypothetical protein